MDTIGFDGARAFEHLRVLTEEIGPRHGGSRAEARAARYIRDQFRGFGLKPSLFAYKTHTFESATASLQFSGLGKMRCLPVPCCESTPVRGVTAGVVLLEQAHAAYLDESMRGKILVTYGEFHGEHYEALIDVQPAGVVYAGASVHKEIFLAKLRADPKRQYGTVPMVRITYEDGQKLFDARPRTATLQVQTRGERLGRSYNPIGELKGARWPDQVVVIGGHYDSVWGGAGSQDNAAGMAVVLELARIFGQSGSPRTLRFMGFGGEEQGLCGSIAYVKKLKDEHDKLQDDEDFVRDGLKSELDKIRFMINIDVQGARIARDSAISCGHPDIAASVRLLAAEKHLAYHVRENEVYSSDNVPFGKAGVPSLAFARGDGATGLHAHTEKDTLEHCDAEGLAKAGRLIATWMERYVVGCRVFPFERKIPDDVGKKLSKYLRHRDPFKYEPQDAKRRYQPTPKKRRRSTGKKTRPR